MRCSTPVYGVIDTLGWLVGGNDVSFNLQSSVES